MTLRLAMLKRQMLGMIVLNFCACLPLSLLATGAMVAVQDQATRLQQLLRQLLDTKNIAQSLAIEVYEIVK